MCKVREKITFASNFSEKFRLFRAFLCDYITFEWIFFLEESSQKLFVTNPIYWRSYHFFVE
jgi:hypothetical protein